MRRNNAKIPKDYVERVYAGWLGKMIGVRHGSNIEGWSSEGIYKVYGEMEHAQYLYNFKNFAADDDTNGPVFFIRALEDYSIDITAEQIGTTWLNYVPYEHGFYWWGGYGVATEHTAYLNLRNGIMAPRSGSSEQNGTTIAEQIGGQIFIDPWGLMVPVDYHLAAEYARMAASVSHDGNGVYGGMFIAACISAAFIEKSMEGILNCGLKVIPQSCEYAKVCRDVIAFYKKNPENWHACLQFIQENYGYDRYPGNCHIIPNAAIIVLALSYGEGDFTKSINLANMCGWDTDCNVGNVGTIVGVFAGLDGIAVSWRKPINDLLICSSVLGSMNIRDAVQDTYFMAQMGYQIAGETPPERWNEIWNDTGRKYSFELPGSTHAFRVSTNCKRYADTVLTNTEEQTFEHRGSLKVGARLREAGDEMFIYLKTYYRPEDFDDNRGAPAFSPILYPGQRIEARVMVNPMPGIAPKIGLYVKDGNSGQLVRSTMIKAMPGEWQELCFDIPPMTGTCLTEAGVTVTRCSQGEDMVLCYLDEMSLSGKPEYTLDFTKERIEQWTVLHNEVSQCTYVRGNWTLEGSALIGSCADLGEAYTGAPEWTDYTLEINLQPILGEIHRLNFRVQGAIRSYAVGLAAENKLILYKNNNGYQILAQIEYPWKLGEQYILKVQVRGAEIEVLEGSKKLLTFKDETDPYLHGQVGFSVEHGSRCAFRWMKVGRI